jgi:hypothetical protein
MVCFICFLQAVKMFCAVVAIFGICWLPYHAYFIYAHHHREILRKPYIQHVYLGFFWLAMSNSMANPIIYYMFNTRFRQYFVASFLCVPRLVFGQAVASDWEQRQVLAVTAGSVACGNTMAVGIGGGGGNAGSSTVTRSASAAALQVCNN